MRDPNVSRLELDVPRVALLRLVVPDAPALRAGFVELARLEEALFFLAIDFDPTAAGFVPSKAGNPRSVITPKTASTTCSVRASLRLSRFARAATNWFTTVVSPFVTQIKPLWDTAVAVAIYCDQRPVATAVPAAFDLM